MSVDLFLGEPVGAGSRPRLAIERAIREAVQDGRLAPGQPLPSTRALAHDLGLARGTVVEAYSQLSVEGYIVTAPGRLARVADLPDRTAEPLPRPERPAAPAADFRAGMPDTGSFPRAAWLSAMRRVLTVVDDAVLEYRDAMGEPDLRACLADYLRRTRGVQAEPDAVAVCSGFLDGAALLCGALRSLGHDTVAVENPSLPHIRAVLERDGMRVVPVPVDGEGMSVDELARSDATVAVVTPAHQFPLGVAMTPRRRSQLVAWARDVGGFVVEDDYDGEFRFDRTPLGAVQGLDAGTVVYAGTASKSLAPGLRLGWLVVPPALRAPLAEVKELRHTVPVLDQLTFAEVVRSGRLDRHVRRMRAEYRSRRNQLVKALAATPYDLGDEPAAGLHAVIRLPTLADERAILDRAGRSSIGVQGLSWFYAAPPRRPGLVVAYGRPPAHRFRGALRALVKLLQET